MCGENSRKPSGHVNPVRDMKVNMGFIARVMCYSTDRCGTSVVLPALHFPGTNPSADND